MKARHGEYIDRNRITVAAYLDQWLEAHAVEVEPKTLQDYRHLISRHGRPHIGDLRLQAITPARITKLYRELATSGGQGGAGLSPRTVEYVHAVLRKAFRDTVVVDQILPSNPVERAKRPHQARSEPGQVWTPAQLRAFLNTARQHRLFAFYRLAAYTGARRGELLNLAGGTSNWMSAKSASPARPPSSRASAWRERPRAADPAPSASTPAPCRCSEITASARPGNG